ncbi:hypothetical protein J6590_064292 [Homalodisca vitripennis]|nr:hypothetical protein J6590_064292 [Homalodisca vitripennis]
MQCVKLTIISDATGAVTSWWEQLSHSQTSKQFYYRIMFLHVAHIMVVVKIHTQWQPCTQLASRSFTLCVASKTCEHASCRCLTGSVLTLPNKLFSAFPSSFHSNFSDRRPARKESYAHSVDFMVVEMEVEMDGENPLICICTETNVL